MKALHSWFSESDEQCMVSYKDRKGKYQGQTGVTLAEAVSGEGVEVVFL